jgi:hypothetical protein
MAQGSIYYLSPTGANTNPGTIDLPWKTFRRSLPALKPGDTLIVRDGVYPEVIGGDMDIKIRPARPDAPILVQAYPGEKPIVRGLFWLINPSYWTIDGINVNWRNDVVGFKHMVKITNGVGWTFKNAELWGAKANSAILIAGTVENEPADWRLAYCVIHDTIPTYDKNQDHLIYANTGLTAGKGLIERNILYNATNGHGIKVGSGTADSGSANITIRYNTVYNTVSSVFIAWKSSNNLVYRNMFEKVGDRGIFIRGYQLTGTGNIAFDNAGYDTDHFVQTDDGYTPIETHDNVRATVTMPLFLYGRVILNPRNLLNLYGRYADPAD